MCAGFSGEFEIIGIDIDKNRIGSFSGYKVIRDASRLPIKDERVDFELVELGLPESIFGLNACTKNHHDHKICRL